MNPEALTDNGGRRFGPDRRKFIYAIHIPEQRCGKDRRSDSDRRRKRYNYRGDLERREILKT